MKNLETLLLNDNIIQSLGNDLFNGLDELRTLFLYRNKIRNIEERAFHSLPKLEQLYLQMNKIEKLHPHMFDGLTSLQRLFLHENKIQYIPTGAFSGLGSLKRLRLDSNSLVCDCGMKEVMSAVPDISATCVYPENMRGKTIREMKLNDIHCNEPRILEGPHDVEVSFGGSAVFTCRVDGDPQPEVTWMLNSNEIDTSNPKYSIKEDGTLIVSSMTDSDMGVYECMVKSPNGVTKSQAAKTLFHQASGVAEWNRKPKDQVAREGDTVQLECSVSGGQATWVRNGTPVSLPVSAEGTLTLQSVSPEDAASYTCIVETSNGRLEAKAQLTVTAPPRLTIRPESIYVKSGETIKLRCEAKGQPEPTITWFKNGTSLQPNERITFNENSTEVTITRASSNDGGLYTCLAQSILGTAEGNGEVRVRLDGPRPPTFVHTPYPIAAHLGTSVELPCKAQGEPYPAIQWFKNGDPIQLDQTHRVFPVGSLRIYNITPSDGGIYRCTATNEHGEISVHATLTVEDSSSGIGDNLVLTALEDAKKTVDKAVNSTIEAFFSKKVPQSPSFLMRVLRYPDEKARSVVRAADIYENTLINIRKHIASGIHFNNTEDFHYEDVLSSDQLQLIARMSGCMEQLKANCSDLCFHNKYRTIDGTCNNLQRPYWGASHTAFRRLIKPIYENGFSNPVGWDKNRLYNGFLLPNARRVSLELIRTENITQDDKISHMVMQWGQFLDHDLDHAIPSTTAESWEGVDCKKTCKATPPCFPMEADPDDPRIKSRRCMDFIRSSAICGSGMTSIFFNKIQQREQINQLTAFIDATQVYGFHDNRSILLRDYTEDLGLLRVGINTESGKPLLPLAGFQEVDCRRDPTEHEAGCFLAGDIRVNEQISLVAMHTIWLREHNRIATELKKINPHWTGNTIFHEARKIVGAEMQHITFKHWLPNVLGDKGLEILGNYQGYNPNIDPGISNEFATSALRFGHTLINPVLARLDSDFKTIPEGDLPLGKAFFSPWRIIEEGGVDALMRGMWATPAKKKMPNQNLNNELTDHLFTSFHAVALDLASMNVQRSRDHGIPFYNEYRKLCNLSSAETFEDLAAEITDPDIRAKLQKLYGDPRNIDIFVGGILEDQIEGAKMGPTFRCILTEQFRRIRDGDRFWYENPSTFKPAQLTQIKQSSLARILCDNGDNITAISPNVFIIPEKQSPSLLKCEELPEIDLRFWYECEDCENDVSSRGRRGLVDVEMEDRMEGLENMVEELQKTVKSLKRRMKGLTVKCRDNKGNIRHDGDSWQKDSCTLCECQGVQVSCTRIQCANLNCEKQQKVEGRCCPVCA